MRFLRTEPKKDDRAGAGSRFRGLPALFTLLILLAASLAGCGKKTGGEEILVKPAGEEHPVTVIETADAESGDSGKKTVYFVVPSEEGPSLTEIRILTEAALEEGVSMMVLNYMNDPIAEASAIEQAVSEGAAVIICDNIDETQTLRGIRSAKKKGIPVFLIGRGVDSMGMASAQILTESYTCVRKMGEEYVSGRKKGAAYVVLNTSGTENDLAEAFSSVMEGRTGFQELDSAVCDGQNAGEAYDAAWELMHAHPNADTIVCVTSVQALAAADAAADQGLSPMVMCLSGDTDEIVQSVEQGRVHAAIVKPAKKLAERAALSLKEYLETGELPDSECYYVQGEIRISGDTEEEKEP